MASTKLFSVLLLASLCCAAVAQEDGGNTEVSALGRMLVCMGGRWAGCWAVLFTASSKPS